jgi:hypothetical protein
MEVLPENHKRIKTEDVHRAAGTRKIRTTNGLPVEESVQNVEPGPSLGHGEVDSSAGANTVPANGLTPSDVSHENRESPSVVPLKAAVSNSVLVDEPMQMDGQ